MSNKYLEKLAEAEYTDKRHAKNHVFGTYSLAGSKEFRSKENVGGALRTHGRAYLGGAVGGIAGMAAGAAAGHGVGRLAGRATAGTAIGAVGGYLGGYLGGAYHGALTSVRNRIDEGKLPGVNRTGKK
jgi:hypothetical protein